MLRHLIILFLVVLDAVAVRQRIGTLTRALRFPTREYDDRNGDFPLGAVLLKYKIEFEFQFDHEELMRYNTQYKKSS